MQLFLEAPKQHPSRVFPPDFQERLARSIDVVRELRARGVSVVRTDAASGEMPLIEINPAHAEKLKGLGRGHRMVRTQSLVVTHSLIVNECEVTWFAHTLPARKAWA